MTDTASREFPDTSRRKHFLPERNFSLCGHTIRLIKLDVFATLEHHEFPEKIVGRHRAPRAFDAVWPNETGKSNGRFRVVGDTSSAPVARKIFSELAPDLIVLSLTLQHGGGFSLLKDSRKMNPAVRTLVVTARQDSLSVQRAFKAGARGYVIAEDETAEVLLALERVCAGDLYASGTVAQGLLKMLANGSVATRGNSCQELSDRELQIFRLIGGGFGTSRVASELQLSLKTIETHRQRIKQKLRLTNGAELIRRATEWLVSATRERGLANNRPQGNRTRVH